LLHEQLNATIRKYTDTALLPDKGRESRKKVHSVIKSLTRVLPRTRPTISMKRQWRNSSLKYFKRVLIYLVKISTCKKLLIKTDLPWNDDDNYKGAKLSLCVTATA
jgi:hypothetical protein